MICISVTFQSKRSVSPFADDLPDISYDSPDASMMNYEQNEGYHTSLFGTTGYNGCSDPLSANVLGNKLSAVSSF